MAYQECIARLGCWEGYEIEHSWEEYRGEQRWCVIRLRPVVGARRYCSGCGCSSEAVHDSEERRVRDLPIFEVAIELIVPRLRWLVGTVGRSLSGWGGWNPTPG